MTREEMWRWRELILRAMRLEDGNGIDGLAGKPGGSVSWGLGGWTIVGVNGDVWKVRVVGIRRIW